MHKSRLIKKRNIVINGLQFVYSVTEYASDIRIKIYLNKKLILNFCLNYPEAWGINVFRPKTVEILIHYFNKYHFAENKIKELYLCNETELFNSYLEYYFPEENDKMTKRYLKLISEYNDISDI